MRKNFDSISDNLAGYIKKVDTGVIHETVILPVTKGDLKNVLKKNGWNFKWKIFLLTPKCQEPWPIKDGNFPGKCKIFSKLYTTKNIQMAVSNKYMDLDDIGYVGVPERRSATQIQRDGKHTAKLIDAHKSRENAKISAKLTDKNKSTITKATKSR